MVIHVIGTVNGQVNEGMRNVATHLAKEFEKDNTVLYSGLKQIPQIVLNSRRADATMIFARANKLVYSLASIVTKMCRNTWIVLVQKPDSDFMARNNKHPLKCSYLSITEGDMKDVKVVSGCKKKLFSVGIKAEKFAPVSAEQRKMLKQKYGFDPSKPLVIHVGHCSKGRGLEDFAKIHTAQRMVVASGMFEDENVVRILNEAKVKIHKGYLENVEEVYQMADAYLFPTRSAEFVISIPLSVMEALSCGVPVIGYKSFENLNEITGSEGAITLVDNAEQLDKVLPEVIKKKSDHSLLEKTGSECAKDGSGGKCMKPAMISFMGLDGSGKSTSIDYAYEQLKKRGYKVEIVRAAYVIVFLRGVIKLGKKILMKKDSDPFSGDYKAYLESLRKNANKGGAYKIFSFLTTIEFKLQIFFKIRLKRFFGTTLLVDRYIYDNVVTYAANLDLGEEYMEETMNGKWKNAPRPDKIIYIKTPVEVCCSRKDDIPDPLYLEIRKPRYEKVAEMYNATVIAGDQDKQKMLDEVMAAIDEVLPPLKK